MLLEVPSLSFCRVILRSCVLLSCFHRFLATLACWCTFCPFLSSLISFLLSFHLPFFVFSSAILTLSITSSLVKLSPVLVSPQHPAEFWQEGVISANIILYIQVFYQSFLLYNVKHNISNCTGWKQH